MNFIACLSLFLAPSIYFLIQNLGLGKDTQLFSAAIISIDIFAAGIFFTSPLLFLKNKNIFFNALLFTSSCWYFQFLMPDLISSKHYYFQMAIITLLSLVIVFISTQINISKFLLIFIGLNLLVLAVPKADYLYTILGRNLQAHKFSVSEPITKIRDVNIYYILSDGLTSPEELKEKFKVPTNDLEKNLKTYRYSIFNESKSSYNLTHLTLASIFSLDYPVIEGSQKYKSRIDFFPNMLSIPQQVPLLAKLKSLNYKFVHVGNKWANCNKNKLVYCLSHKDMPNETPLKFYIAKLFENYPTQTFLQKTLFEAILYRLLSKNKLEYESFKNEGKIPDDNDALGTITNAIKFKKLNLSESTFYFVHHYSPHPPYLNEDCTLSDNQDYKNQNWNPIFYSQSSKCTFSRISEFIRVLNEADPNAIVVIQGDHGPAVNYSFDKDFEELSEKDFKERFSIFNAVKLPTDCVLPTVNNLGNVETIQLIVGCVSGTNVANEYSKSYAGFYEGHKNYGQVYEVIFKKLTNAKP